MRILFSRSNRISAALLVTAACTLFLPHWIVACVLVVAAGINLRLARQLKHEEKLLQHLIDALTEAGAGRIGVRVTGIGDAGKFGDACWAANNTLDQPSGYFHYPQVWRNGIRIDHLGSIG
jgi:hypothetical protein